MPYNNIYLALSGTIKHESEKAVLFEYLLEDGIGLKSDWFPHSQIASIHRNQSRDDELLCAPDVIMASEWILRQKNAHHLATKKNPATSSTVVRTHPKVPSIPPAKSFVDMDDDIPF